jgi:N-acetylglucosaminyldiphosphoundecaprenol N-acetyl-beta-D-mannosaminyltransferase
MTTVSDVQSTACELSWPTKYNVLGVHVSATTYEETVDTIIEAAKRRVAAIASFHAVHAVVTAAHDAELREVVNSFEIVAPDGQPVRWALNLLYGLGLRDRVYGPELMLRLCERAAAEAVPIYLYGSTDEVIALLRKNLCARFEGLIIAGAEAPPFRELTESEKAETALRINESGARLLFVGLGCPKQDLFASANRDRIAPVQLCVGAAFDFHAGCLPMAPEWMQRCGLEWLYRLAREPKRLWQRYFVTNTLFILGIAGAMARRPLRSGRLEGHHSGEE